MDVEIKFQDLRSKPIYEDLKKLSPTYDVAAYLADKNIDLIAMILGEAAMMSKANDRCDVYLKLLSMAAVRRKPIEIAEGPSEINVTPKNVKQLWQKAHEAAQKKMNTI